MRETKTTTETMLSRRKYLFATGSATAALSGCIGTAQAQPEVTMGELNIDGDDATIAEAPSEITVSVNGRFETTANKTPEQCQVTLQCHVGEEALVDDIASEHYFDTKAGEYEVTGDLLDHRDVTADDMMPTTGESITVPLLIRVVLSVVSDGSIKAESFVESEAPLKLTAEGIEVMVGGSGTVEVVA